MLTIITHKCIHWDEAVAIFLIKEYGNKRYLGIKKAKIEIYDPQKKYSSKDILIGVGGGIFDEHRTPNSNGNQNECAATLIAKYLEIADLPEIQQILKYTLRCDNNPATSPFEIASLFNLVSRKNPEKPEKAYKIAEELIKAKLAEQKEFFEAIEIFLKKVKIQNIEDLSERIFKIAVIKTENPQILKAARYINKNNDNNLDFICKATDILIVFREDGHCQIFNTQYRSIDLTPIAIEIRKSELVKKGLSVNRADLKDIGVIEDVEEWCLANTGQLLNGSFSAPYTPRTKQTAKEIIIAVIYGINPKLRVL